MQRKEKLKLQDEPHCCVGKEWAVESFNWTFLQLVNPQQQCDTKELTVTGP